jgi:hypothetical protein
VQIAGEKALEQIRKNFLLFIQPAVESDTRMIILGFSAVVAKQPDVLCQLLIAAHDHAAISHTAKIFGGKEAEAAHISPCAQGFTLKRTTWGMSRILDDGHAGSCASRILDDGHALRP